MRLGTSFIKFSIVSLFILSFLNLFGDSNPTTLNDNRSSSSLYFNLDECSAYNAQLTSFNYDEFTSVVTNSSTCLQMSSGTVHRDLPLNNPHSCTPGVNGSIALCVSSVGSCDYPAGHTRSILIDVLVEPGTDGTGTLSSISFYEKAPAMFDWINGCLLYTSDAADE